MKKSLFRPFGWILPLAAVATAMLQAVPDLLGGASVVFSAGMIGLLGMPEALRRAQARAVSRAKVVGLGLTAFLIEILIALGVFALWRTGKLATEVATALAIGGLYVFLRTLQEHFAADDDRLSAVLIEILGALSLLALTSMRLSDNRLLILGVPGAVCALGVLIALVTGRRHGRTGERVHVEPALLKEMPLALVRVALYPALCVGMWYLQPAGAKLVMFALGACIVEAGRSAFRRNSMESAGFSCLITVAGVIFTLAAPIADLRMPMAALATLLALYAVMNVRAVLAFLLMTVSAMVHAFELGVVPPEFLPVSVGWNVIAALILSVIAAVLMIPEWRELHRQARVKHIRNKAMKRASKHGNMTL